HRFTARNARRTVYRLWRDRPDTLQTQRHLKKNSRASRNPDPELRGHPARTADRRSAATEIPNFSEAGERGGVLWNFARVVRPERGAVSRTNRVRSRETQHRRDRRGIHRRARALCELAGQYAVDCFPNPRAGVSRSAAERTEDRDLQGEVERGISQTMGPGRPVRRRSRADAGVGDRTDMQ